MNAHTDKTQEMRNRSAASTVSKREISGASTFQFADNRPKAIQTRKLQEMASNSPQVKQCLSFSDNRPNAKVEKIPQNVTSLNNQTIQRMVAIAREDMSTIDDPLILNNLDYAKSHFGGPVGDFLANKKFDQMGDNQQLGIVEHGLPGTIGNYDATGVADILTDPSNHIPKSTTSVVLYSCFAAADKAGPKSSLVQGLSVALKDKGYEIGVEGQVGVGFGFKGIGERTTKGDFKTGVITWAKALAQLLGDGKKYEAWRGGQFSLKSFGINGNMYRFATTDVLLENVGGFTALQIRKMSMEEKATQISKIMKPFWRDAEVVMGGGLHDHLDGWLRVKSYVSGDELVQRIGI